MMSAIVLGMVVVATTPPDYSKKYFPGLARPHVSKLVARHSDGPVILIVVDAMRPDRITPYGFSRETSPRLRALADEGVIFTNYYVNGNWTRPTTASMLTGLPPAIHGVERERDRLADQFVTAAEVLSDAGVETGAVVGNGNAGSAFGLSRGFRFYADTVKHWKGLPSAEQVTELAVPFVRQNKDKPFFLMLFFVDPHDPYHAPGEFENMFVSDPSVPLIRTPHWELGRYSEAQVRRMKQTYDGAVRYTDSVIGRFFDTLKELGVYDKATLIVTADHGEAFGEHGVYLHSHHLYDEIIRAPLIIKTPKMSVRGGYSHYLFESLDLLPTLAGLFGARVKTQLPGVDILANLADPKLNDPRRLVISEFHNFGIKRRTARTYDSKLIYSEPADEKEFRATVGDPALLPSVSFTKEEVKAFDIARDPFEKAALSGSVISSSPRFRRLLKILKAHRPAARDRPAAEVAEIDPETTEDLRALGYIQ